MDPCHGRYRRSPFSAVEELNWATRWSCDKDTFPQGRKNVRSIVRLTYNTPCPHGIPPPAVLSRFLVPVASASSGGSVAALVLSRHDDVDFQHGHPAEEHCCDRRWHSRHLGGLPPGSASLVRIFDDHHHHCDDSRGQGNGVGSVRKRRRIHGTVLGRWFTDSTTS